MSTTMRVIKTVSTKTKFTVVHVDYESKRQLAFLDQDGDVVGFLNRDRPYFPHGELREVYSMAESSLKIGAQYFGFPAEVFCSNIYQLVDVYEYDSSVDSQIRELEEVARKAQELADGIRGIDSLVIEGEHTEITP